jgi:hypothetical protein
MLPTESSSQVFVPLLGREERLLWSAQPRQGIFLRSTDAYLIPFSLFWGGFAFFWEGSAVNSNAPVIMRLWGIPFVLIGLYLIIGRFFVDAKLRSKTYYALTTERIVIVSGLFSRTTKSLQLRTLSDVSLAESKGGLARSVLAQWRRGGPGAAAGRDPSDSNLQLSTQFRPHETCMKKSALRKSRRRGVEI